MAKQWYKDFAFRPETLDLIEKCDSIIEEYQAQGFQLTLRQVYYKLVARDLFPDDRRWRWTGFKWVRDPHGTKNAEPNYKWLGGIVNDARLAGRLDWEAIEDRTRSLESLPEWDHPRDIVASAAQQFHVDLWQGQDKRVEVWIEKDALVGIIEPICRELDVDFFSCRGYTSQSEMWRAAQRLLGYINKNQQPVILHFGDHDPSGRDMSRDIEDRLEMFIQDEAGGPDCFELHRIALNMDQVRRYHPPPNPAKLTDSRCAAYVREFGDESWELDALEPVVITALIRSNVEAALGNDRLFRRRLAVRTRGRRVLTRISRQWERVAEAVR